MMHHTAYDAWYCLLYGDLETFDRFAVDWRNVIWGENATDLAFYGSITRSHIWDAGDQHLEM